MTTPTRWPYKHSVPKDPDATLDYTIDWSDWLATGETIVSSIWHLDGVTLVNESFNDTSCTIFVSGGTVNVNATLTNTITTNNSIHRIDERTLILSIKNR